MSYLNCSNVCVWCRLSCSAAFHHLRLYFSSLLYLFINFFYVNSAACLVLSHRIFYFLRYTWFFLVFCFLFIMTLMCIFLKMKLSFPSSVRVFCHDWINQFLPSWFSIYCFLIVSLIKIKYISLVPSLIILYCYWKLLFIASICFLVQ